MLRWRHAADSDPLPQLHGRLLSKHERALHGLLEHDMVQDELEQRDDLVCGARHVQPVHVVAVHE